MIFHNRLERYSPWYSLFSGSGRQFPRIGSRRAEQLSRPERTSQMRYIASTRAIGDPGGYAAHILRRGAVIGCRIRSGTRPSPSKGNSTDLGHLPHED